MTTPIDPPAPANPEDVVWQIEDNDPTALVGGQVDYDFNAPDPEDG